MIVNYFNKSKIGTELLAVYRSVGKFIDSQRIKVIQLVVEFMMNKFGDSVSSCNRKMVARATIALFKCWVMPNSKIGGIVSLHYYFFPTRDMNA